MSQEVKLEVKQEIKLEKPTAEPGPSAISEPGSSVKTSETKKPKEEPREEMEESSDEDLNDLEDGECDGCGYHPCECDNFDAYHPIISPADPWEPNDPYHEPTDVGYLVVDMVSKKDAKGDYKCPENSCEYSTKTKALMGKHYKTHGRKQFACKLCDKKYGDRGTCMNHIRTHDDRYKFRCPDDTCRKRFSVHQQMKKHCRDNHGIELESRRGRWILFPGCEPPLPPLPRMNERGKLW